MRRATSRAPPASAPERGGLAQAARHRAERQREQRLAGGEVAAELEWGERGRRAHGVRQGATAEGDREAFQQAGRRGREQRLRRHPGGHLEREGHQQGDPRQHRRVEHVLAQAAEHLFADHDRERPAEQRQPPWCPRRQAERGSARSPRPNRRRAWRSGRLRRSPGRRLGRHAAGDRQQHGGVPASRTNTPVAVAGSRASRTVRMTCGTLLRPCTWGAATGSSSGSSSS